MGQRSTQGIHSYIAWAIPYFKRNDCTAQLVISDFEGQGKKMNILESMLDHPHGCLKVERLLWWQIVKEDFPDGGLSTPEGPSI